MNNALKSLVQRVFGYPSGTSLVHPRIFNSCQRLVGTQEKRESMVFSCASSDTPCSGNIVKPNTTNLPSKDDRGQEDTWVQSQGVRMILCHSKVKLTIRSAISYRRYAEPMETLHRLPRVCSIRDGVRSPRYCEIQSMLPTKAGDHMISRPSLRDIPISR